MSLDKLSAKEVIMKLTIHFIKDQTDGIISVLLYNYFLKGSFQ